MSRIAGRHGRLYVSADGVTYTLWGAITDLSMSGSQESFDQTSHDSTSYREYLAGRKSATMDVSCNWDSADAGQDIVRTLYFSGANVYIRFYMYTATGDVKYEAQAIITSYAPKSPNDDLATLDVSLQLTGSFAEGVQS